MKLTIIGSVALDTIETPHTKRSDMLGGSATYASISASFFAPVNLISVIGEDFPKKYFSIFTKRGIDLQGLKQEKGRTFRWEARYIPNFNYAESVATHLNVFQDFRPLVPSSVTPKDNLFLANIDPDLQLWLVEKIKPTGLVSCDTMNHWIQKKRKELLKLVKRVDLFLLNDAEARLLSGTMNLADAAKFIFSKGAKMVVIKKGEHGVLFFSRNLRFVVPAYLLETVVDPTGAGDSFGGGMIGYLTSKKKITSTVLRESIVYGSILASFAVERFSVEGLLNISISDIKNRIKNFRHLTKF